MRLLGRLVLVPLGLLFAIPGGVMALGTAAILDPIMAEFARIVLWSGAFALADSFADGDLVGQGRAAAAFGWAATLLVAPPVFVALVGEVAGLRALAWHAGGTGLVTALLPWLMRGRMAQPSAGEGHLTLILFGVGAIAGAIYWLIAGRSAGIVRPLNGPASSGA